MSKMHRGWECQDIVNILILIQDTEATMEATAEVTVTMAEVTDIMAAEVTATTVEATEATTVAEDTVDTKDEAWS